MSRFLGGYSGTALPRPDRVFEHPVGAPTCTVGSRIHTSLRHVNPLHDDLQQVVIIASGRFLLEGVPLGLANACLA